MTKGFMWKLKQRINEGSTYKKKKNLTKSWDL